MVLAYNARLSTHDVDAIILSPHQAEVVRSLAQLVAMEQNLPEEWLNDGAKGYLVGYSEGEIIFSAPGIVVHLPSVAQLLAMKLSAWRDDVDIADARRLLVAMSGTQTVLAATAAIIELLAQRRQQRPPTWTQSVGAVSPPVFLLKSANKMRRLREMCQAEAPEPLRRRGCYAPANYLEFV